MDLNFTDEQRQFAASANALLSSRARRMEPRELWREIAALGWLGLPLPEAYGGLGQGAADVGLLAEVFGRHRVRTDYIPCIVLCGSIIASTGSEAQKSMVLPDLAAGTLKLALAHAEAAARHELRHVTTTAQRNGGGWTLNGRKISAIGADDADKVIVSARIAGNARDEAGVGLFLVERAAAGLQLQAHSTVDGASAARLTLERCHVPAEAHLGHNENALAHLQRAFGQAMAAWSAELVGLMEAATSATIEYTKTRIQFGRPLAANQVLRHRMADMSIQCEEARSMALRAALFTEEDEARERDRAISGAWSKISRGARFVAEQAIQLHGGMGVTEELPIGTHLKRVLALDAIVGSADFHLRRHSGLAVRAVRAS